MAQQYLSPEELNKSLGDLDYQITLIKTDSIDENEIIESIGDNAQLMFCIAAQIAIIGIGGRNYNKISFEGEELDLVEQMDKLGIKYNNTREAELSPGDLTPRRLCRIYRSHIHNLIKSRPEISSYLWRKYSDHDQSFRPYCFPGAEHLIDNKQMKEMLLETYVNLDSSLEKAGKTHGLCERVERVFLARGI